LERYVGPEMRILRETLMTEPLLAWLREKDYEGYCEIGYHYSPVDMVGIDKDKNIICIEMKTSLTKSVIRKAANNQLMTKKSYCAIPTKPRKTGVEKCIKYGLGLLIVKNSQVEERIKPIGKDYTSKYRIQMILECAESSEPGGQAGVPQLKGVSARIEVKKDVNKYREKNPKATWQEMFEKIPNHYSSYKSMRSAVSK